MQDFTSYAMGARVDGELVLMCPYCHTHAVKRGITEPRFVHSAEMVEIDGRSELTENACPKIPVTSPSNTTL
jgi:hypothetical protein